MPPPLSLLPPAAEAAVRAGRRVRRASRKSKGRNNNIYKHRCGLSSRDLRFWRRLRFFDALAKSSALLLREHGAAADGLGDVEETEDADELQRLRKQKHRARNV